MTPLHFFRYLLVGTLLLFMTSCARKVTESGKASYYADKFQGRRTANGEIFRQQRMTAAHRTLQFGAKVKVKNLDNGRTIKVRINDRGPFVAGRIIDLSRKAAKKLGMTQAGVANVQIIYKPQKKGRR
ncbi:septal ring lytic transglycosylase RlpA family protein [Chitinophaga lutea]|uniref:Probable endolytic peptidoglycan transglycosylase RlpA n=1 Tax=Chitinophaga lutea TaxID=2488634 RepID=A0A3N4PY58_9BACT|nr:septal ring lytic transglycosylase RlpA family protein [Chitinophaga lutea]RPE13652.1 septal ring lytic transglycosylase RlpA family protein [Chitinophaga lutea]